MDSWRDGVSLALLTVATFIMTTPPVRAAERPGLLFREDWKETPAATPVTQEHVANPDLIVSRHGPAEALIKKSHHDKPADDPFYIWSGEADRNWAISLRHRSAGVDLSGPAKIRWRAKQSGFRQLRIILKLASGSWIVSDQYDDESADWRVREFNLPDIRWRELNIKRVAEGKWVPAPDLSAVEEIGWTDLMPGGGTPASSRLDWIEVYGRAVSRTP
ncbi:MAG: hypothetical protein Q7S40_09340 [Opitutaceae bacterium]|nr:hypothetical protein [Opitutaceae bacterium]